MNIDTFTCRHCGRKIRISVDDGAGPYDYVDEDGSTVCNLPAPGGHHDPMESHEAYRAGGRTEGTDFITALLKQGEQDAKWLAETVDRDYRRNIARLTAELRLVRERVYSAYSGPYQPNEHVVLEALVPTHEEIETQMRVSGWTEDDR